MNEQEHEETQLRIMKDLLLEYEKAKSKNPSQSEFYDKRIAHRKKMINLIEEKLAVCNKG